MITENDLKAAIAECQGKRDPDASTCIKLAAYYTIKEAMFPANRPASPADPPAYSYAPPPDVSGEINFNSDSEFAEAINGRRQEDVWPVLDELMTALKTIYPRLYNAVLAKLE